MQVQTSVLAGRLKGKDETGVRVGRIVSKYKVAAEAALAGAHVIRANVAKKQMSATDTVRNCKGLCEIERAFRSLQTVDLKTRRSHHHLEDRVRAHIVLCMLGYCVEWPMREAWRDLRFAGEDLQANRHPDPVAPAKRSEADLQKVLTHTLPDGTPAHSLRTLLEDPDAIVRNTRVTRSGKPLHRPSRWSPPRTPLNSERCSCCSGSPCSQGASSCCVGKRLIHPKIALEPQGNSRLTHAHGGGRIPYHGAHVHSQ